MRERVIQNQNFPLEVFPSEVLLTASDNPREQDRNHDRSGELSHSAKLRADQQG